MDISDLVDLLKLSTVNTVFVIHTKHRIFKTTSDSCSSGSACRRTGRAPGPSEPRREEAQQTLLAHRPTDRPNTERTRRQRRRRRPALAAAAAASPRRRKEGPRAYDVLPLSVVAGRRTETKIATRDWQRPWRGRGRQLIRREEGRPPRPFERRVVQQVPLRDEYYLGTREVRQVVELHSERKESMLKREGEMGLGGVGRV